MARFDPSFLAARHPWVVRIVLVVACLSLLATSDGATGRDTYAEDLAPTTTELTPEAPARSYRVSLRAKDPEAWDQRTTLDASATVRGSVSSADLVEGAPTPYVTYAAYEPDGDGQQLPLHALADFETVVPLGFRGDCQGPGGCVTSFVVELSRADDGASGGTVIVDWSLYLRAYTDRYRGDRPTTHPLPWEVTIEAL
jgi:hypothetical protein